MSRPNPALDIYDRGAPCPLVVAAALGVRSAVSGSSKQTRLPTHFVKRNTHSSLRYQPILLIFVLVLVVVLVHMLSLVGGGYIRL